MRSLADALDRLQQVGSFHSGGQAEIRTWSMNIVAGQLTGFPLVLGPPLPDGSVPVVKMPPATKFSAKTRIGGRQTWPITELQGAISDCAGNVSLVSGLHVYAVNLIPAPPLYQLTPRESAILLAALCVLNKHEECYPEIYGSVFPNTRAFRFDRIAHIRLRNLKRLHSDLNSVLREPISLSVMSKALARVGMQLPHSRNQQPDSA
jgi:hypothetical protein